MTLRRALTAAAISSGALLLSFTPAHAQDSSGGGSSGGDGGELPNTGFDTTPLVAAGAMAIAVGSTLVVVRRRAGAHA